MTIIDGSDVNIPFIHTLRPDGIMVFKFYNTSPDTLNVWVSVVNEHDQQASKLKQHVRSMYLMRRLSPTPYLLSKMVEAFKTTPPNLPQSIALVTSNSFFYRFLKVAIKLVGDKSKFDTRLFQQEASAVEWLHQRTQEMRDQYGIEPYIPFE